MKQERHIPLEEFIKRIPTYPTLSRLLLDSPPQASAPLSTDAPLEQMAGQKHGRSSTELQPSPKQTKIESSPSGSPTLLESLPQGKPYELLAPAELSNFLNHSDIF